MFFRVITLLCTIGFPKIPFLGVPLFFLIIPFYIKDIIFYLKVVNKEFSIFIYFWLLCLTYGAACTVLANGGVSDFLFFLNLLIRLPIIVLAGIVVFIVIKKCRKSLFYWLAIQLLLMISALFNPIIQSFLGMFLSGGASNFLEHTFGLRTIGFGLLHMDGAILLLSMTFYLVYFQYTRGLGMLALVNLIMGSFLARTALIPFALFIFFSKQKVLKIVITLSFIALSIGILFWIEPKANDSFEIFRAILTGDGLSGTQSTRELMNMYELSSYEGADYILGDGRFFDGQGYYMKTDVGYFRIAFFSGIFGLLLFIAMNCCFNISSIIRFYKQKRRVELIFTFILLLITLIMNFKGIFTFNLLSVVMLLHSRINTIQGNRVNVLRTI